MEGEADKRLLSRMERFGRRHINWILSADYLPPVEDVEALPEGEDKED